MTAFHENIPFIIFTNLSCFLASFFFYFLFFLFNQPKDRVFYTLFEHICLYYCAFFSVSYPCNVSFPHRQRLTKRVCIHFSFSDAAWRQRIDKNLTSDTAHHALTSSRLENAWRYFCARTASSTYFHISTVGFSLAIPDFLFLLPLMTRTMVVRVYEHARVSSE